MNEKIKFSVRIHQGGYTYETLRRIWTDADRLGYYSATLYDLLNIPTWNAGPPSRPSRPRPTASA